MEDVACSEDRVLKESGLAVLFSRGSAGVIVPAGALMSGSGWITVPPPLGFSTFFIRMGIFLRITYKKYDFVSTSRP